MQFLEKNASLLLREKVRSLVISAIKQLFKIEESNVDLKCLKGNLKGYYRIRTGKLRIIFTLEKEKAVIAFVREVTFRKDAYK